MPIQLPTVGRIVLYHAGGHKGDVFMNPISNQPHAAIVAHVNTDNTINLAVIGHDGLPAAREGVLFWDGEGRQPVSNVPYAYWPPGAPSPR